MSLTREKCKQNPHLAYEGVVKRNREKNKVDLGKYGKRRNFV